MTNQIRNTMRKTEDLVRNNRKVRYAAYAVLFLATAFASYGLGERFGQFVYVITH
ncbi:MAG: hypothetical protein IK106_03120 [Clostridiales bacterium]|nr:hypothetical protein [Clostridiales bacterium]